MRLKLEHDKPLSNFAFKFNLRRYNVVIQGTVRAAVTDPDGVEREAGAYTRPLFSST
jgi:hypothetical protein